MIAVSRATNFCPKDLGMFQQLRVPVELLEAMGVRRVSDFEAREIGIQFRGTLDGILFAYRSLSGEIVNHRLRRDNPEVERGELRNKYVSSFRDRTHFYYPPNAAALASKPEVMVILVEAEKSVLALHAWAHRTKRDVLSIGLGGCWGWHGKVGIVTTASGGRVDEVGPIPDFAHIHWEGRDVVLLLDSNVTTNPKVRAAEQRLAFYLESFGAIPRLARLPKETNVNGPDDYLAAHTDEEMRWIIDAAAADPWPDAQPVKNTLLPVIGLPRELIPEPFRLWLADISQRMGCPLEFVAVAALVAAGSLVGAGCGIRPKQEDDWLVIPNLWGAVVGRPSIMLKSPALREATLGLEQLAREANESYEEAVRDHAAELALFKAKQEAVRENLKKIAKKSDNAADQIAAKNEYKNLTEPQRPRARRYKTNDATIEKLGELLSENPRGLLVFRDELVALFAAWDKEGHEADRAFFLEAWNGSGSHETDRIGRGTIRIPNACVSVLGGIQPSKLQTYLADAILGNDNDGLIQRLQMLVYPDEPSLLDVVDRRPNIEAKEGAHSLLRKLAHMDFGESGAHSEKADDIPFFHFDQSAQRVFYAWLNELNQKLRREDEDIVTEHLGKYRKLMPSLALIFHLIDIAAGAGPGPIPEITAKRAAAWCELLESHARRVYGLLSNMKFDAAARLARKLQEGALPNPFSVRDLYRRDWTSLNDKDLATKACEELVELGWLREGVANPTGGRSQSREFYLNPSVRRSRG